MSTPSAPRAQNWLGRCLGLLRGDSAAPYIAIALLALALRVWFIVEARTYVFEDVIYSPPQWSIRGLHFSFGYETGSIAHWLAVGKGFASPFAHWSGPTAWIAPVYPSILAGCFLLFGLFTPASAIAILTFNSLCSALTCITLGRLGERLFGREVGLTAALGFAVLPYFWRWPTTWVWEMPLSGLLLTLAVLLTFRLESECGWRPWAAFGVFWGLCGLTNPTMLSVLPFTVLWAWGHLARQDGGPLAAAMARRIRYPLLIAVAFLVTISPWLVRNRLVFGRSVYLRSNAAAEMWFYNYPGSNGMGFPGRHPTQNPRELARFLALGEIAYVAEKQALQARDLRADPEAFAGYTWTRIQAYWFGEDLDYQGYDYWGYAKWQAQLLAGLAALGLLLARYRANPRVWLVAAAALAYPFAYYLTMVQPRYRHAVEPLLLLLLSIYTCLEAAALVRRALARLWPGRRAASAEGLAAD